MHRVWAVLTWSPIARMPWHAKLFNMLWCWTLVLILLGWCDDTVHFDGPVTDDDIPVLKEPNWNADLRLPNGQCLVIGTRQYIEC